MRSYGRDWYVIAEKPAPAPHFAHPEECAALRIVLVAVPRVSRSCEHFPDGFDAQQVIVMNFLCTTCLHKFLSRPCKTPYNSSVTSMHRRLYKSVPCTTVDVQVHAQSVMPLTTSREQNNQCKGAPETLLA